MATGMTAVPGRRALDAAGAALLVASIGWTGWTAVVRGGEALPVASLQVGCALAYLAARAATRWQRPVVPMAVVTVVTSLLVIRSALPSLAPVAPPLGYANANAALYVLVAVAAIMAAAAFPPGPATAVGVPMAAAFALAAVASGSTTGAVVLMLAASFLGAGAVGSWRGLVPCCAVALLLLLGVTALVGIGRVDGTGPAVVERLFDDRRVLLWRDAAVIAHRHPIDGAGPGRFQEESPTAASDADARWAHSGFFQQAAEQGAVGLTLLLAAFGWGFLRVWHAATADGEDTFVALGALTLAVLGIHAGVDYVLHFPAVPLVGAALLGAATAPVANRRQARRAGRGEGSPG